MQPNDNDFPQTTPEATDFTPLVSHISELLGPDLENRIRNELKPAQRLATGMVDPANRGRVTSTHDALSAAVDSLDKAKKDLDALRAYFENARQRAAQQLKFHASFKAYVERTTDRLALRSELVAPIRRLPNEVLQLIFLESHMQSTERERYNPITAQVCTFWRQLAHATSFMWTSININVQGNEEDMMDEVAELETRMGRAKGCHVAVRFSQKVRESVVANGSRPQKIRLMSGSTESQGDHPLSPVIAVLLKYKDRLASLYIPPYLGASSEEIARKCATESVTFDNLHTLSLFERTYASPGFDVESLLKACPNIERLRMYAAPATTHIHWEKLKEFSGNLGTEALSTFLSRAQGVKQARIVTPGPSWATLPTITFSNRLTALSLGYLGMGCAGRLAGVARPSALQYLILSGSLEAAATLVGSWGRDLEFLGLAFETTVKQLKNLLTTTPNLQGLRIRGHRAAPPSLFTALPKLTHLEIQSGIRGPTEDWVRQLLSRPLKPTSRGKRLLLRSFTFLPDSDRVRPQGSSKEGWESLYRDLRVVNIKVHEYPSHEIWDTPAFNTAFFQERGWSV